MGTHLPMYACTADAEEDTEVDACPAGSGVVTVRTCPYEYQLKVLDTRQGFRVDYIGRKGRGQGDEPLPGSLRTSSSSR